MREEQKTLNYLAFWLLFFLTFSPSVLLIAACPLLIGYIIRLSKSPSAIRKTQKLNISLMIAQGLTIVIFWYVVMKYESIMYQAAYIYSENATNSSGYIIYLGVMLYLRLAVTVLILIIYFIGIWRQKKKLKKQENPKTAEL